MVNPINETVSVSSNAEDINKNPKNTAPKNADAAQSEVVARTDPKLDESYGSPEIKESGKESADHSMIKGADGEIRKSEVSDGEVTINVYDRSGKLLRKQPPGYLPVGEQKFDVTV